MNDVPLDEALIKRLAEQMVFGPQVGHQYIRHNALMVAREAYVAGYRAGQEAKRGDA